MLWPNGVAVRVLIGAGWSLMALLSQSLAYGEISGAASLSGTPGDARDTKLCVSSQVGNYCGGDTFPLMPHAFVRFELPTAQDGSLQCSNLQAAPLSVQLKSDVGPTKPSNVLRLEPAGGAASCAESPDGRRYACTIDNKVVLGCSRVAPVRVARAAGRLIPETAGLMRGQPDRECQKLYDDPRIVEWAKLYLAGKGEEVLRLAEADLLSSSPHPFTTQVWVSIHDRQWRLKEAWAGITNPNLRAALGPLPDIEILKNEGHEADALRKYPANSAEEINDLWALSSLQQIAWSRERYADGFQYTVAAARLAPHWFQAAWVIEQQYHFPYLYAEQVQDMIRPESEDALAGTPFIEFVLAQRNLIPRDELVQLAATDKWLEGYPLDARAQSRKGLILLNRDRPEEALASLQTGVVRYPFFSNWDKPAIALVKLGRFGEAQAWIEKMGEVFGGDRQRRATWVEGAWADVLIETGEKGQGRAVLDQALRQWPKESSFHRAYARLELGSGRPLQALAHAKTIAEQNATELDDQLLWVETLEKSGELAQAARVITELDGRFPAKSQKFYDQASNVLGRFQGPEERLRLLERGVAEFPESEWLQRDLAEALMETGRKAEAMHALRVSLAHEPINWSFSKIIVWVGELYGEQAADKEIEGLLGRYPWSQFLWEQVAGRIKGKDAGAQVLTLWQRAIQSNPGRVWPWRKYVQALVDREHWEEALGALQQADKDMVSGGLSDALDIPRVRAYVIKTMGEKGKGGKLLIEEGLAALDQYRTSGGGDLSWWVHDVRSKLLLLLNRKGEAAEYARLALRQSDDYKDVYLLLNRFLDSVGFAPIARAYKERFLDRDPFNADALVEWARIHVQWGGSPLVALKAIHDLKERRPDQYTKGREWEIEAAGQLGDYQKKFEFTYTGPKGEISGRSDRYIGWYERDRRNVLSKQGVSLNFDPKTSEATITHPDGTVVVRRDHPISGKPMLLKQGPAFVEAQYDEAGADLIKISASSGAWVRLTYYPNHMIERVVTSAGDELRFEYNNAVPPKPTVIEVKGVGVIQVTYGSDGEILKVDSPAGRKVALKTTEAFQTLLGLITPFQSGRSGDLPDLPYRDQTREALVQAYEKALGCSLGFCPPLTSQKKSKQLPAAKAALALARHLVTHVVDSRHYAKDARHILRDIIEVGRQPKHTAALGALAGESVVLWHDLMNATRPHGLSKEDFAHWSELADWLSDRATGKKNDPFGRWVAAVRATPLRPLPNTQWLPTSDLANTGFWHRYAVSELLPLLLRKAEVNALLIRRNGDVVAGTSMGLAVLRRGFWEWFGFDEVRSRWSPNADAKTIGAGSEVRGMTETEDGVLWLATGGGVMQMGGAYDGGLRRWRSEAEGLPTIRIRQVAAYGEGVLVGTRAGLRLLTPSKVVIPIPELAAEEIRFLRSVRETMPDGSVQMIVLIATPKALYGLRAGTVTLLQDGPVDDAVWSPQHNQIFALRTSVVTSQDWAGTGRPGKVAPLADQSAIRSAQKIYGLAVVPLDHEQVGIGVLTDQGLGVYHEAHVEFMDMPLKEQRQGLTVGPRVMTATGESAYFATTEGVYAFERGQAWVDRQGRVYDLLADDGQGVTFVARGEAGLYAARQVEGRVDLLPFAAVEATHLAQDQEGRLITNDGLTIVRFDKGSTRPQELFSVIQTTPEDRGNGPIRSLLVSAEGAIWVTAGSSAFKWQDGQVEEFSIFKDSERFPSRSDMISRVVETVEGRIWIVASDEGHLSYQGMQLEGGILEWTGQGFRRLKLPKESEYWFLTSYTRINQHTAIAGTTKGFVRHRRESFASFFDDLKDTSYKRIHEQRGMLWLGRGGAKLGEESWLFGSAGGVLLYQAGQWLYPDRLNQMLPDDQQIGQYGGRTVHAVAVDKDSRIYVGTDRGLLVYDTRGGAPAFLVSNTYVAEAFGASDQARLRQEAEVVFNALPPESSLGKQVTAARDAEREVSRLEAAQAPGARLDAHEVGPSAPSSSPTQAGEDVHAEGGGSQKSLPKSTSDLQEKRRQHAALLARIEAQNKSLHQMLEMKPLELSAVRSRLKADQIILQYLPTKDRLFIHLVSRDSASVREVEVKEEELRREVGIVTGALGNARTAQGDRAPIPIAPLVSVPVNSTDSLRWLYDHLLRPVQEELEGKTVFVVPAGNLAYVPFAALVRSTEPRIEYAVERFTIGYLTSAYMFNLVMEHRDSTGGDALVFGDPDGSLPEARQEARAVQAMVGGELPARIGAEATYETLVADSDKVRLVHLATHGKLNAEHPDRSYLVLANGYRLGIADIAVLDLTKTDLVVLSACETGLGVDGLEYATLARAFATAHAPSIMATLWQVPDAPSLQLVSRFYQHWKDGADRFTALAKAQRDMLAGTGVQRNPRSWAGYVIFGKP